MEVFVIAIAGCVFFRARKGEEAETGESVPTHAENLIKSFLSQGTGSFFSMKDLDTLEMVEQFVDAGIDSLKNRGAKKKTLNM